MTTPSITPATDGQRDSILELIRHAGRSVLAELGFTNEEAQEILRKGGDFKKEAGAVLRPLLQCFSVPPHIILVPDLPAAGLTALLKRERKLTYLDPDQEAWDFYTGLDGKPIPGRGKKFEARVWKPDLKPGQVISSDAVRDHFRQEGFTGNVGAFTQWLRQVDPAGYYASIPDDNGCWRSADRDLYAPFSFFDDGYRKLRRHWIGGGWIGDWSFVGFREIP